MLPRITTLPLTGVVSLWSRHLNHSTTFRVICENVLSFGPLVDSPTLQRRGQVFPLFLFPNFFFVFLVFLFFFFFFCGCVALGFFFFCLGFWFFLGGFFGWFVFFGFLFWGLCVFVGLFFLWCVGGGFSVFYSSSFRLLS